MHSRGRRAGRWPVVSRGRVSSDSTSSDKGESCSSRGLYSDARTVSSSSSFLWSATPPRTTLGPPFDAGKPCLSHVIREVVQANPVKDIVGRIENDRPTLQSFFAGNVLDVLVHLLLHVLFEMYHHRIRRRVDFHLAMVDQFNEHLLPPGGLPWVVRDEDEGRPWLVRSPPRLPPRFDQNFSILSAEHPGDYIVVHERKVLRVPLGGLSRLTLRQLCRGTQGRDVAPGHQLEAEERELRLAAVRFTDDSEERRALPLRREPLVHGPHVLVEKRGREEVQEGLEHRRLRPLFNRRAARLPDIHEADVPLDSLQPIPDFARVEGLRGPDPHAAVEPEDETVALQPRRGRLRELGLDRGGATSLGEELC